MDSGGFADYTTTTHLITKNRFIPISCNNPDTWHVSVRPLQNKQAVAGPQIASIVAGGGGVAPTDEAWNIVAFNVSTISGIIASVDDLANNNLNITPSDGAVFGSEHLNGK